MAETPAGGILSNASCRGQPCVEISLPQGDRACIALHGAHVLSWQTADGKEQLYLSSAAKFDGVSPIRGGVPVCFPQFNQRTLGGQPLPKHGFARTQPWTVLAIEQTDTRAQARLQLCSNDTTRAIWPHEFAAILTVQLDPGHLHVSFEVQNTGPQSWLFALALHTYLQVDDISQTCLQGLQGLAYWDAVENLTQPDIRQTQPLDGAAGALAFKAETDRVYEGVHHKADATLQLQHAGATLQISQSPNLSEIVVWNPGAALCASIEDLPNDGYRHMLCVEAACINSPVRLAAGQRWSGWQALEVRPAISTV